MTQAQTLIRPEKQLPDPDGDFYMIAKTLTEEENAIRLKVRDFMEREVEPIIDEYWERDEFPFELLPKFKALNIMGISLRGTAVPGTEPH